MVSWLTATKEITWQSVFTNYVYPRSHKAELNMHFRLLFVRLLFLLNFSSCFLSWIVIREFRSHDAIIIKKKTRIYKKRNYCLSRTLFIGCNTEHGTRWKNCDGHGGPPAVWPVRPSERSRCCWKPVSSVSYLPSRWQHGGWSSLRSYFGKWFLVFIFWNSISSQLLWRWQKDTQLHFKNNVKTIHNV